MTLLEYNIPSRPHDGTIVYPLGLTVTQDRVWFSEWNTDKIGVLDRNISIPFDISTDDSQITIPKNTAGEPVVIDFTIHKNSEVTFENPISFAVSSSMEPALELVNMTAKFSNDKISSTEIEDSKIRLLIESDFAPVGNYTLAISATDGLITKSVFMDMMIN